MADYNSVEYAKQLAALPSALNSGRTWGGRVRCLCGSYTAPSGGVAVGKTIALARLKAGQMLSSNSLLKFAASFASSGTSISVGLLPTDGTTVAPSYDLNKYMAAANITAAGVKRLEAADGFNYEVTKDSELVALVGGAAAMAEADAFEFELLVFDL